MSMVRYFMLLSTSPFYIKRKRRRSDSVLWQNPLYPQKMQKQKDNTQTPPKTSITQRLRTDLGRSVGVLSHPTGIELSFNNSWHVFRTIKDRTLLWNSKYMYMYEHYSIDRLIVGIPMDTNCAPLLADIFLYSYETEFIQSLLSARKKQLAIQFNFTYRYIDDVLSIL